MNRLTIPRDSWVHYYIVESAEKIPTKQIERRRFLEPCVEDLFHFIDVNMPCIIVGMGKLAAEVLVGGPYAHKKIGAWWEPKWQPFGEKLGIKKVWLTYTAEAALYDPNLAVDITGILDDACEHAGIPTKPDLTLKFPTFWVDYSSD